MTRMPSISSDTQHAQDTEDTESIECVCHLIRIKSNTDHCLTYALDGGHFIDEVRLCNLLLLRSIPLQRTRNLKAGRCRVNRDDWLALSTEEGLFGRERNLHHPLGNTAQSSP